MGRELALESPNQRPDAGTRVDCVSGNCCDPATFSPQWDMDCIRCIFCPDDAQVLADAKTVEIVGFDSIIFHDFRFEDGVWVYEDWDAGGYQAEGQIALLNNENCDSAANTLYHEVRHLNQPASMSLYDKEYDAFYSTEEWTIQKGLQDLHQLRMQDAHGNEVVDPAAVDHLVLTAYFGTGASPTEKIVGFDIDPPMTIWENILTGEQEARPSQEGEYMQGTESTVEGKRVIPRSEFTCDG